MMRRAIAWIVCLGVCAGCYAAVKRWNNPWQGVGGLNPITAVMPAMPDGCAKRPECK